MLRGGSDLAKQDLPPELSAALRLAWALAARLGHACVGTEHLLLVEKPLKCSIQRLRLFLMLLQPYSSTS